jgi:hypothetical protein
MNIPHRTRVVMKLPRRQATVVLGQAKAVYNALGADPTTFTSPNPPLPILLTHIQEVDVAQQATSTRARGTAAARNAKLDILITSMESERMYVQTICDANPERAVAIATSAAMSVGSVSLQSKPVLQAKLGTQPGSVLLLANGTLLIGRRSSRRAVFQWQMSADGGKTWTGLAPTPLASTEIDALTPLTVHEFRVCVTIGKVTGEWSQAVSILVH